MSSNPNAPSNIPSNIQSNIPLNLQPDAQLDLRGTPCPINFVRTKLKLEQLPAGLLLEVWLDEGEPIEQVPDSLRMHGYSVERLEEREGFFALQVRRPDAATPEQPGVSSAASA